MNAFVLRKSGPVELIACQNGHRVHTPLGDRPQWQYAVRTPEASTKFTAEHAHAQGVYDLLTKMESR